MPKNAAGMAGSLKLVTSRPRDCQFAETIRALLLRRYMNLQNARTRSAKRYSVFSQLPISCSAVFALGNILPMVMKP